MSRLCRRGPVTSPLALRLAYDPTQLDAVVETMELKDRKQRGIWGNPLRRILLVAYHPSPQQSWTVTFTRAK